MYFGIASNDDAQAAGCQRQAEGGVRGRDVPAEIEVYAGALHGWCVPDMPLQNGAPIYNKPDAERAWGKLIALYRLALA